MVSVVNEPARDPREEVEAATLATIEDIMRQIEKQHARIGAVIFSQTPWTIEAILTPTMKIRREQN